MEAIEAEDLSTKELAVVDGEPSMDSEVKINVISTKECD